MCIRDRDAHSNLLMDWGALSDGLDTTPVPYTHLDVYKRQMLGCAVPALACHLAFETTLWSLTATEWGGVLGLGLGSIGLAFVVWDIGMKQGDVALLGVASYAAPVLSTLILVLFGYAPASWLLAASCALIVVGALVASGGGTHSLSLIHI